MIKENVSVISSNPSCNNDNAGFPRVALKALSEKVWVKCLFSFTVSLRISSFWEAIKNLRNKHVSIRKNGSIYQISDQDFKGTVANRTLSSLNGGSLEITLTVTLRIQD